MNDSSLSLSSLVSALDSLAEGFAVFDAQDCLLLANRRARDMFPDLSDEFVPGVSFATLLKLLLERGGIIDAIGREEEWATERLAARRARRGVDMLRRPGGRCLKVTEAATPDGGTVLIYRDFTELRRSEDELATATRILGHSERLAALGELVAGITHEIKNSLSLMSNFSEISGDMVDELRTTLAPHIATLDRETQAELAEMFTTLTGNLATVVQHGTRADAIVRSMLQSTRGGGSPVPTTINALVEEALTLAGFGTHARTPGFGVVIERKLDASAGTAHIDPQEISRVMLNLYSNAFHAMHRRQRESAGPDYRPTLQVFTSGDAERVLIRVRDNGTGIRPADLERLFTRFFTTKPVGEGTGLGLALCRDIVRRHHGHLTVASTQGEYAEFSLELPRTPPAGAVA